MKKHRLLSVFLVLCFIFSVCTPLSQINISAAASASNAINSVFLNGSGETVNISASLSKEFVSSNKNSTVYLFAIPAGIDSIEGLEPIASSEISQSISFAVSLGSRDDGELLYCSYQLALLNASRKYDAVTGRKYLMNPELLATDTEEFLKPYSKKGLYISNPSEAELLGVSQTVITVAIDQYLSDSEPTDGAFKRGKLFFDEKKIKELDATLKEYYNAGIFVYLNFVMSPYYLATSGAARKLYTDDAHSAAVNYCSPDMSKPDTVKTMRCIFEYFAERYTRPDHAFGFAGSFIIGYNVNDNRRSNYSGHASIDSYTARYAALLRIADTALRSHYSHGTVYTSVSNVWVENSHAYPDYDETLDYSASEFLTLLNSVTAQDGSFPWGVSLSPFASDLTNHSVWKDALAENSRDTPYVTVKNIDVAVDLMCGDQFRYNGEVRSLLVGRFGISGYPGGVGEANQAASFAYSYYKAASIEHIDGMIYYRQNDTLADGGYCFGLRRNVTGTADTPGDPKSVYSIFSEIDITKPSVISASVMSLLGADMWEASIPGWDDDTFEEARTVIKSDPINNSDDIKWQILADFTDGGADSFEASMGAEATVEYDIGGDKTFLKIRYPSGDIGYSGISANITESLKYAKKLRLSLGEFSYSCTLMLRLSGYDRDGKPIFYESVAELAPDTDELVFDISKYTQMTGDARITVWLKSTHNSDSGKLDFPLLAIDAETVPPMPTALKVFLIILAVIGGAVFLFAAFIGALWIRAEMIRRRRRKEKMKRRNAPRQMQPRPPNPPNSGVGG